MTFDSIENTSPLQNRVRSVTLSMFRPLHSIDFSFPSDMVTFTCLLFYNSMKIILIKARDNDGKNFAGETHFIDYRFKYVI